MAYRIIKGGVSTAANVDEYKKALAGQPYERVEFAKDEVAAWLPKDAIPWLLEQGEIEEVTYDKVQK